ncbi:MAG TPA: hypothetical protein VFL67_05020 [Mycobacterium sp.]|nr:hypothetical protein [Mycobacterium sp.]
MALTDVAHGTVTTSTTETAFGTGTPFTAAGNYVLLLDLNALVAGDIITVNVYTKTLTGSTARIVRHYLFSGIQGEPNFQSIVFPSLFSFECKIRHATGGSARGIDYTIASL